MSMVLGELISALEGLPQGDYVSIKAKVPLYPTKLASWRGVYAELALGYDVDYNAAQGTVAALVAECRSAIGKTFEGWKGGSFRMTRETRVWLDNPGCCNSLAIHSLRSLGDGFSQILVKKASW